MADVVLFHHVLGATSGVDALADRLRADGHTVHTPDLFDGRTFASIEEGAAHVDELGIEEIIRRGEAAVEALPAALVPAGVSLGVVPAQKLAQTRPGTRGAVFLEACLPADMLAPGWPAGLPVQIHGMDADPFFAGEGDVDAARTLVADVGASARAELFTYPGDRHLFTDASLDAHDPAAVQQVVDRVLDFLAALD